MKIKRLWRLYPIVLLFGIIIFFETKSYFERKYFFESDLNTLIVRREGNWSGGRSYDYITKNGIVITLIRSDSLNVELGDSIVKKVNSWDFDIFKRDINGMYKVYKNYNLKKQ